jgi:PAS domain S-box-containing protein
MDLVYPSDQALVLRMWNNLVQGTPVTFEMRWKPRQGSNEVAQWVLSACVPIYDNQGVIISIAGNTIDIAGQKKMQEASQARVEALEQARLAEQKFTRFAELSPMAIYIFVPDSGEQCRCRLSVVRTDLAEGVQFANDQFYKLTGHSRNAVDQSEWFNCIAQEDLELVKESFAKMLEEKTPNGVQFRLKRTWINQDGIRSNIWVQSSTHPQIDERGEVTSMHIVTSLSHAMLTIIAGIMGTLFDIGQFKWAESVQRRRVEEALESKRQQEKYAITHV